MARSVSRTCSFSGKQNSIAIRKEFKRGTILLWEEDWPRSRKIFAVLSAIRLSRGLNNPTQLGRGRVVPAATAAAARPRDEVADKGAHLQRSCRR